MQELVQLTWVFSRSFSMPSASFSMPEDPGGTGQVTYTTNQKFYPQTHNNTNVHFTHNEIELLNKGLKHNLNPNTIIIKS